MKKAITIPALILAFGIGAYALNDASAHQGQTGMRFKFGGMPFFTAEYSSERLSEMFDHQAGILGVSADEVKSAWAEGKPFHQLAEEKGITREQLQEKMQAAHREMMSGQMSDLVKKGVISREQAQKRLEFMKNHENLKFEKKFRRGVIDQK